MQKITEMQGTGSRPLLFFALGEQLSRATRNQVKTGEYFLFVFDIFGVCIYNVNCRIVPWGECPRYAILGLEGCCMRLRTHFSIPLEKEARRLLYGRCRFDERAATVTLRKHSPIFPEEGVIL